MQASSNLYSDDPSPEDLQRAFRDEQQARTAAFNAAMHNGTPNEPERELSAADIHAMLTDLMDVVSLVTAYLYVDTEEAGQTRSAAIFDGMNARLQPHRERLKDAPPF